MRYVLTVTRVESPVDKTRAALEECRQFTDGEQFCLFQVTWSPCDLCRPLCNDNRQSPPLKLCSRTSCQLQELKQRKVPAHNL